eukprot:6205021-Pleurochrysis_carterae.AAC.4
MPMRNCIGRWQRCAWIRIALRIRRERCNCISLTLYEVVAEFMLRVMRLAAREWRLLEAMLHALDYLRNAAKRAIRASVTGSRSRDFRHPG